MCALLLALRLRGEWSLDGRRDELRAQDNSSSLTSARLALVGLKPGSSISRSASRETSLKFWRDSVADGVADGDANVVVEDERLDHRPSREGPPVGDRVLDRQRAVRPEDLGVSFSTEVRRVHVPHHQALVTGPEAGRDLAAPGSAAPP